MARQRIGRKRSWRGWWSRNNFFILNQFNQGFRQSTFLKDQQYDYKLQQSPTYIQLFIIIFLITGSRFIFIWPIIYTNIPLYAVITSSILRSITNLHYQPSSKRKTANYLGIKIIPLELKLFPWN